jgi:tRNA modification GTPase
MLVGCGVARVESTPQVRFPEAHCAREAQALEALARAKSPKAVEVLLAQCDLARAGDGEFGRVDDGVAQALDRLIDPPTVVALGGANIGKSTLLNALAKRSVSVVSAVAGTTRDHVGVELVLDGVCVRWVDTPGLREGAGMEEERAVELALGLARTANLLVACADARTPFPSLDDLGLADRRALRVGLRSDLGVRDEADLTTAAGRGEGLDELARAVREALVRDSAIELGRSMAWAPSPMG